VDIIATEMQLLGGREGMGGPDEDGGGAPRRAAPAPRPAAGAAPRQAPAKAASGFEDMDADIPF
jgi:single-strand DNA-binding protein